MVKSLSPEGQLNDIFINKQGAMLLPKEVLGALIGHAQSIGNGVRVDLDKSPKKKKRLGPTILKSNHQTKRLEDEARNRKEIA